MKILENIGVTAPQGFKAAGVACGIKASGKKDMALIYSEAAANMAAAFTTNQVVAAPVSVCKELLRSVNKIQAVVINSGNANACTGERGYADALEMSRLTADKLGLESASIVASTGIIGETLPMDKVRLGIETAAANLSVAGDADAAEAIRTTDAFIKRAAVEIDIAGVPVRIGGMAKGAGMIAPRLLPHATMIAVITTDAKITPDVLNKSLAGAIAKSFNRSTVDGETSTNDSVFLLANGMAGNDELNLSGDGALLDMFQRALNYLMIELTKLIVRDGEGATKLIRYKITGAETEDDAVEIGMKVANSLLVKTAFFGRDPNWGRILVAAGMTKATMAPEKIDIYIGDEKVVHQGLGRVFDSVKLDDILTQPEISVTLDIGLGTSEAVCYGCDLSYDYVKINAEYRT